MGGALALPLSEAHGGGGKAAVGIYHAAAAARFFPLRMFSGRFDGLL